MKFVGRVYTPIDIEEVREILKKRPTTRFMFSDCFDDFYSIDNFESYGILEISNSDDKLYPYFDYKTGSFYRFIREAEIDTEKKRFCFDIEIDKQDLEKFENGDLSFIDILKEYNITDDDIKVVSADEKK